MNPGAYSGNRKAGVIPSPSDPLDECVPQGAQPSELWRPGVFSAEDRWEMADVIVAKLREKYGELLLGVAVEGSTAKGLDAPHSDLELRVVLADEAGIHHRWHAFTGRGMFIGISYNAWSRMIEEASSVDYEWPKAGDSLFTCKVMYDPTGVFEHLRELAVQAESQADWNALLREALLDMYESVLKLFSLGDQDLAVALEARSIAYWAAMAVGIANRYRYLSGRNMFEESLRLKDVPEQYGMCLRSLLSLSTSARELRESTAVLWSSCADWARQRGIELQDDAFSEL